MPLMEPDYVDDSIQKYIVRDGEVQIVRNDRDRHSSLNDYLTMEGSETDVGEAIEVFEHYMNLIEKHK
jgi:hypothetical protein